LLDHPHDLIHKAIGWVLREIGKRDKEVLLDFLERNFNRMPRTSLRYAIERFPKEERQYWLKRGK
ncbi:MAG: DNA alkylation repair protein, partial [Muribaculaceae bacterium]|nr:DNA alkylation repair protein [Muribaculaceae bacterium]